MTNALQTNIDRSIDAQAVAPKPVRRRRIIVAVAAVATALTVVGLVHAAPASALAWSSSVQQLQASAYCKGGSTYMGVSASMTLDQGRYPNGTYVTFQFWMKDTSSTQWKYGPWTTPTFVDNSPEQGGIQTVSPMSVSQGFGVTVGRSYVVVADVGVWNPSTRAYEYTRDSNPYYLYEGSSAGFRQTNACYTYFQ